MIRKDSVDKEKINETKSSFESIWILIILILN